MKYFYRFFFRIGDLHIAFEFSGDYRFSVFIEISDVRNCLSLNFFFVDFYRK